jgi:hypothetical protein
MRLEQSFVPGRRRLEGHAGRTKCGQRISCAESPECCGENAPGLRHVTLYQGGKASGADLGPFKTPAREDDPRLMGPNFYYDQEDFLKEQQSGWQWHYSVLRPEAVCGFAVGNPINLIMVIGVYAAISKELGLPLRFSGPEAAYRALYQVTSADILAKVTAWAARLPRRQTRSATSQTATTFDGSLCDRGSLVLSTWKLPSQFPCP